MQLNVLSLTLALFASSVAAAYNYTCPPTGTGAAFPTGYGGPTAIPFEGAGPVNKLASPALGLVIAGGVVMLF